MRNDSKNTRPGLLLALLLTAAAGSAAELPDPAALTPDRLAAYFASIRFELRAELQAPRPGSVPRPSQPAIAAVAAVAAAVAVAAPSAPRLAANF